MKKPLLIIITLFLWGVFSLYGQGNHYVAGNFYINSGTFAYIATGDTVHIEGNITTARNVATAQRGMLSFAGTAGWVSSNESFVNGYVRSHKPDFFVFPVGQGAYRPAAISNSADAAPTDVAYYNTAQYPKTAMDNALFEVTDESWIIQGTTPAVITLSWSSDISAFAAHLNDLCVAGWDNSLNKWVEISSTADATSPIFGVASNLVTQGTLSTSAAIVPNSYAAYTLGRKCQIPDAPSLLTDTLPAFRFMPIDLISAVDTIPGFTYIFYENSDKTGLLSGSVVTFIPPKDDYYVIATNGNCEGIMNKIILKDPCPETIKDGEDNVYKVTSLAGLCWTENLRTPAVDDIPFGGTYTCSDCPAQLDTIFGLLYTWYAAINICPDGWRIPTQAEWSLLASYTTTQLMSTKYWLAPPGVGTDEFGFNALPAGWYNSAIDRFEDLYGFAGWWASDTPDGATAHSFTISYYCNDMKEEVKKKADGLSVRCVME